MHEARTFLVMVFFALGAAAFFGAVACTSGTVPKSGQLVRLRRYELCGLS